jgi:NAD(P)-dependent dehydrogenase (short-subunit alcohol dehydrogenase family)
MKRLQDKVAVIFGAGPNIGGTIAHIFAREGAKIVMSDIDLTAAEKTSDFLTSRGFEALALAGSATDEDDVRRIITQTTAAYGRLDCVVNTAGQVHFESIVDMELHDWNQAVLSFPTAGMLTTKYAAKTMINLEIHGSIIHLLSTAAHFGQPAGAAYGAAKAALLNFARNAAMELAAAGIRVNTITPCAMEHQLWTNMKEEVDQEAFVRRKDKPHYSRDDFLKSIPMGRFPRAIDLAWAAVFLASDESGFITGIDIPVDGGLRHKYPAWTPGDATGVNIADYVRLIKRTEYGEECEPVKS